MAAKGEGFEEKKKKQPCFDGGKGLLEAFLVLQRRSCIVDGGGCVTEGREKKGKLRSIEERKEKN